MHSRQSALFLATIVAIIYGVNYTIAKEVMPHYIKPFGFILARVIGAGVLFWISGFFIRKEKIAVSDYKAVFLAALFGMALNMLAFFKGLNLTTPISASVIMTTTPIIVLSFSALFLKEAITKKKVLGIVIGMIGAIGLIVYGQKLSLSLDGMLGNFLILVNAASYGMYLIVVKGLTKKYHPITLAKWMYLIGFFLVLPFGYHEFIIVEWSVLPVSALLRIGFVVMFTTYVAYMFNLIAIKKLKPTTLSIFIYLQPVIATSYALAVGSDSLNLVKILATSLIFVGVYLVTKKPREQV